MAQGRDNNVTNKWYLTCNGQSSVYEQQQSSTYYNTAAHTHDHFCQQAMREMRESAAEEQMQT